MAETELKEVSIDTLPMKEFKEARSKGILTVPEKTAVAEPEDEPEETEEHPKDDKEVERPKGKGGFQKRIDKLIREKSGLEERAAAAERKAADLEARQPKEEAKKPAVQGEPVRSEFATDEEYIKAQARWEVRQELKEQKAAEERATEEARIQATYKAYNDRLLEARSHIEDFDEKMATAGDLKVPQSVYLSIIEMENGPEVAIYLAEHPEMAAELMEMSPLRATANVWKLSESLAPEEKEEKEEKPPVVEKIVSKAPPPIKPVGGGSTKSSVPLGEMSMRDYKKARAAGRVS
jgi:hypothetical protein